MIQEKNNGGGGRVSCPKHIWRTAVKSWRQCKIHLLISTKKNYARTKRVLRNDKGVSRSLGPSTCIPRNIPLHYYFVIFIVWKA